MRRPLLAALGVALLALILMFGFSAWIFSRNMRDAHHKSEDRMMATAKYIEEHIREDLFSYPFEFKPDIFPDSYADQQNRWLDRFTKATGLERAVITDLSGHAYVGSLSLISKGDDIHPYLLDTALFNRASKENIALYTPLIKIEGVHFQSLYYPFKIHEKLHMMVLESDQNFIAYVDQFRAYLIFASTLLILLFIVLSLTIFALDKKFQSALSESRRNEHLAFLGRTSAELAHELKNPLAIIKSSVDVLRRKFDPDQDNTAFRYLSEEAMRLSRLITNILSFSKDRPLENKPFQPLGVLNEVRESQKMQFPEVEWKIEVGGDLILMGDRDSFRQVVENITRNATNAMKGKGNVQVTYQNEVFDQKFKGAGLLLFTDSGPGLPKNIRAKMFEPFFSGSKTGTGLGLAIVKSLCDRSGWNISLISNAAEENKPTCFRLRIPKEKIVPAKKSDII